MCGIAGGYFRAGRAVREKLTAIYSNQKTRGEDGAGISIMTKPGEIIRVRDFTPEKVLKHECLDSLSQGGIVLFHHRWPTSTPNIPECNHPICNEDESIHLIHNGIIQGYEGYMEDLKAIGHKFETWVEKKELYVTAGKQYLGRRAESCNDSEVIVHILEESYSESWALAMEKAMADICGSIAMAFMVCNEKKIYLYRGDLPIWVYRDRCGNVLFSSSFPDKTEYKFRPIREMRRGEMGLIENGWYKSLGQVKLLDTWDEELDPDFEERQMDFEEKLFWKEGR